MSIYQRDLPDVDHLLIKIELILDQSYLSVIISLSFMGQSHGSIFWDVMPGGLFKV